MTRLALSRRIPPPLPESDPFEAETAALAALANLGSEGPATARELLRRIERALEVAGEAVLPFKHGALYAVLHELEFEGAIGEAAGAPGPRRVYALTLKGHARLTMGRERWRLANMTIRAAAATREGAGR